MEKVHIYLEQGKALAETLDVKTVVGNRVLSKNGEVLGKVREVRMDPDGRTIQGIIVKGIPLLTRKLYIAEHYIGRITDKAVILRIDPISMYIGRAVVSADGKKVGKVISAERVKTSNELKYFEVRRRPWKVVSIDAKEFAKLGTSLILKKTYADAKQQFN